MPISMRMSCTAISLRRLTPSPPHLRRSPFTGLRDLGLRDPRSGTTLVELCVAMVLLVIVFTGWVRMNNIQAVNKESLRYAAIEKAAGMLEAVDYAKLSQEGMDVAGTVLTIDEAGDVHYISGESDGHPFGRVFPLFADHVQIGYQCHVKENMVGDSVWSKWGNSAWVQMDLFDRVGDVRNEVDPFASIAIFCGQIH